MESMLNTVSILNQITPEDMTEEQGKDTIHRIVWLYIKAGKQLKSSAIAKIKSKAVQKYLLQFDRLTFKHGLLHHLYINNDVEYHQMIIPIK